MVCENRVADFFCGNLEITKICIIFAALTSIKSNFKYILEPI